VQGSVIVAGVLFNILLAWLLLSLGYVVGMPSALYDIPKGGQISDQQLMVIDIMPSSPAEKSGLEAGDVINQISAGNEVVANPTADELSEFINTHQSGVSVSYTHIKENKEAEIVPVTGFAEGKAVIGVSLAMTGIVSIHSPQALIAGGALTIEFVKQTWSGLADFFGSIFKGSANFSDVRGPIGIAEVVSAQSALGFAHVLLVAALISINLAIINLIPIPALDGGRLLVLIIESIIKKPIGQTRWVIGAQVVSFALLILLLVVVSYHDIVRIVAG
jgi:regulator of sigma E protease